MANPMSPLGGLPPSSVAKHVLGQVLAPMGRLEFNKVVESDPISLDLWFEPLPGSKFSFPFGVAAPDGSQANLVRAPGIALG
jgi:hypothetical protein